MFWLSVRLYICVGVLRVLCLTVLYLSRPQGSGPGGATGGEGRHDPGAAEARTGGAPVDEEPPQSTE